MEHKKILVEEEWNSGIKDRSQKKKKIRDPEKEEKTRASKDKTRKGRKDRSQQRQRPAVKATFRLIAIIFSF